MIYTFMYKVYLISSGSVNKRYKIGYTKRDVWQRLKEIKTSNSDNVEIINVFESKWGTKIERALHRKYNYKKIENEWFSLTEDEVKSFKKDCQMLHDNLYITETQNTYIIDKGGIK